VASFARIFRKATVSAPGAYKGSALTPCRLTISGRRTPHVPSCGPSRQAFSRAKRTRTAESTDVRGAQARRHRAAVRAALRRQTIPSSAHRRPSAIRAQPKRERSIV
jgi:hypothetical protein